VSLRVVATRRRKVVQLAAIVLVVTVAMLLLSIASRDEQSVSRCRRDLEYAVQQFRERLATGAVLPREMPRRPDSGERVEFHYHYVPRNVVREQRGAPVGVACCIEPHVLYFDQNGRHMVIYDGRDFEIRWMTEEEFRMRADALGLRLVSGG
jgi:hypothetical protein